MPTGGARARPGPPPNPNALRRDRDQSHWTTLPARREGPVPPWPLTEASQRELQLWAQEWTRPQATQWELNGQQLEVALYVRRLTEAEKHGASTTAGTLVRQMQEALGLSIPGLLRNRWRIEAAEPAEPAVPAAPPVPRRRLVVVDAVERT